MLSEKRLIALPTILAVIVWVGLVAGLALSLPMTPAAVVFGIAVPLLWMTGLRAAAVWLRSRLPRREAAVFADPGGRVALLYCVADDADLGAIAQSMRQDVPVETIILDDGRDPAIRAQIDLFAAQHGCRILRRADRRGFKAGNLNHALGQLRGQYEAYVICDSDVILPPHFVSSCRPALADPSVAVVQALPVARSGQTRFASYFGPLLRTHVAVTRAGREAAGTVAFIGRGALVRAAALDDVGGVPEAVTEDLALSVALRARGWRLVNAPVEFAEDYPIDYRAFRTQMRKTAEGAVEFLRRPRRLRFLPPAEARDFLLETALVPASALAGVTALLAGVTLAAQGTPPPLWAGVLGMLCVLMPLLPETMRRVREQSMRAGLAFAVLAGSLYASTMLVVLAAVLRALGTGRAVFWITPKSAAGPGAVLATLRPELILLPLLIIAAALLGGSPLFALAPLGPALLALAFALPHPRRLGALAPIPVAG